jgi:hypothetical protein
MDVVDAALVTVVFGETGGLTSDFAGIVGGDVSKK